MAARALLLAALLASPGSAGAGERLHPRRDGERGGPGAAARSDVVLDGVEVGVAWTDGDTFRVLSGPRRGERGRLAAVNALEAYGPVHRWGSWDAPGLYGVAGEATAAARRGRWSCTSGPRDAYGRTLVACPDAARALVSAGLAMVFAVDEPPDPGLVAVQRAAQEAGAGMWRGGVPPRIPTSVHSNDEADLGGRKAYDRVVDTRTGATEVRSHGEIRRTCQEVCVGEGNERACLVHVPYERRYRDRPACLRPRSR